MDQPLTPGGLGPPSPERLSRVMLAGAGALLVLHVVLAWWVRQPAVLTGNDDALYLLLGRALRAFTYRDLHVLGQPWHAQYPPGYPLLLALLGGTLGPGIGGPIVLGITLSAISLLLFFDIARRFVPPLFAIALLSILAVNPQLLSYAGSVRSETAYIAVTAAGLWFLVRREDRRGALVAGAVLVLLAALTRSIGVALVAGVAGTWVLERRWRRLAWFGLAASVFVGLWLAWIFAAPQQFEARSYGVMLAQSAPMESTPAKLLLSRALRSVNTYFLRGGLGTALGLPHVPGSRLDRLLGLAVAGVLVLGGMIASWRRGRLLTVYVLMFAATLTVWTYKMTRFLVPLVPVLLLLACIGAAALAGRRGRAARGVLLLAFAGVFLVGGAQEYAALYRAHAACPRDDVSSSGACLTTAQRGFFQAVAFLRDSTPPDALVITTKEAVLGLYTGRTVLHSQGASARFGERFVGGLRAQGDAYILLARLHRWQVPADMVARCGEFEVVRSFPEANDLVRLRPSLAPATDSDACRVIGEHAAAFVPTLPRR